MNETVNKFLLKGDKFMSVIHLKQPGFTYSACGPFAKNKAFKNASNPKYDEYERGLALMVYKFFDKKSAGSGIKFVASQQLADEHHKPIIRKFKRGKVCSSFKENIWGADLIDMQLISKYNKGIKFLLCVIDIFGRYTSVVPLKTKSC